MKILAIGDIHGCFYEYLTLFSSLPPGDIDRLIFLGDLVHKGPAADYVVESLYQIYNTDFQLFKESRAKIEILLGNHEYKAIKRKDVPGLKDHHYDFLLKHCKLSVCYDNVLYCHAGPTWNQLKQIDNISAEKYFSLSNKKKGKYKDNLYLRNVNNEGKFISYNPAIKTAGQHWSSSPFYYNHIYDLVVHGHAHHFGEPVISLNKSLNIDTGCVYGGKLTGAIIENGKLLELVSVQAAKQYAPMND